MHLAHGTLVTCIKIEIILASSPREPVKKERMAKVNKMEKQVNNLEKHVGKGSKVRYNITNTNKYFLVLRFCTWLKIQPRGHSETLVVSNSSN